MGQVLHKRTRAVESIRKEIQESVDELSICKIIPEYLNRLSDLIPFHALANQDVRQILDLELQKIG